MVPAAHAMRSLLALKLFGTARHSHVMSYGVRRRPGPVRRAQRDPQAILPHRIQLPHRPGLLSAADAPLVRRRQPTGAGARRLLRPGLPHHSLPRRGRAGRETLRFQAKPPAERDAGLLAQDARPRVFCYANGDLRKEEQNDEILRFVEFWKERTGKLPEELVFDSKLTTYANLNELNRMGIALHHPAAALPQDARRDSARPRSRLATDRTRGRVAARTRTPRILDAEIELDDYEGPIRQLAIADLGHEEPTLLLTNQLRRSPAS